MTGRQQGEGALSLPDDVQILFHELMKSTMSRPSKLSGVVRAYRSFPSKYDAWYLPQSPAQSELGEIVHQFRQASSDRIEINARAKRRASLETNAHAHLSKLRTVPSVIVGSKNNPIAMMMVWLARTEIGPNSTPRLGASRGDFEPRLASTPRLDVGMRFRGHKDEERAECRSNCEQRLHNELLC